VSSSLRGEEKLGYYPISSLLTQEGFKISLDNVKGGGESCR